jgi:hypothetical protein
MHVITFNNGLVLVFDTREDLEKIARDLTALLVAKDDGVAPVGRRAYAAYTLWAADGVCREPMVLDRTLGKADLVDLLRELVYGPPKIHGLD